MLSTLDGISGDHFYFSNRMIIRDIPPGLPSNPCFDDWLMEVLDLIVTVVCVGLHPDTMDNCRICVLCTSFMVSDFELRVDVYGLEVNKKSHSQRLQSGSGSSPKKSKVILGTLFDNFYCSVFSIRLCSVKCSMTMTFHS